LKKWQEAIEGLEKNMKATIDFLQFIEKKSIAQEPKDDLDIAIFASKLKKTQREEGSRSGRAKQTSFSDLGIRAAS
jgi:hypothetical protein